MRSDIISSVEYLSNCLTQSRKFSNLFAHVGQVICIQSNELVLKAFKLMKDNHIGGLPVIEGPERKIVGSLSIREIKFLLLNRELFSKFR